LERFKQQQLHIIRTLVWSNRRAANGTTLPFMYDNLTSDLSD